MNTSSRRLVASALTFGLGLTFWGCSTDTITNQPVPGFVPVNANFAPGTVSPLFDPTSGNPATIPLPNDLLRDTGATNAANKGLVNQFPTTGQLGAEPFTSLRTLRGFSTAGNILIPFTGQIDAASVNSNSVLLVEGPASTAADADTGAGTNATVQCNISVVNGQPQSGTGVGNSTIVLQPVLPLKPATNYYVVLTNAIQGNGRNITSGNITTVTKVREPLITPAGNTIFPVPDASAQALEPLRAFYQNVWARAEAITGQDRSAIPLVFRFGTQPLFVQLRTIRATVAAQPARPLLGAVTLAANNAAVNNFYANTPGLAAAPRNAIGAIYSGAFTVDNYISTATNPTAVPGLPQGAPIGNFGGTGVPGDLAAVVNQKNKPLFVLAPIGATAATPVCIFQHGITRTKNDVFAIANSLCAAGYVVVATDLVVHGDDTPVTVPPTTTGQLFINLAFLRNSRDNIRQSAVNLYYLTKVIKDGGLDFDGVAGSDFSTANPAYVGMSLGAIVGTVYTATEWNNQTAVLNVAGGRITSLLLNSTQISPQILAGLAGNGVLPGTATFTQFFLIAQSVVDDADPFNYAAPALTGALKNPAGPTTASRVLQQEVINDQVVPNVASRDLARAFAQVPGFNHVQPVVEPVSGVPQANTTDNALTAYAGSGFFQFPTSQHGFLLDPSQGRTQAGQFQVATYLGTALLFPLPKIINPFVAFPNTRVEWLYEHVVGPVQP